MRTTPVPRNRGFQGFWHGYWGISLGVNWDMGQFSIWTPWLMIGVVYGYPSFGEHMLLYGIQLLYGNEQWWWANGYEHEEFIGWRLKLSTLFERGMP